MIFQSIPDKSDPSFAFTINRFSHSEIHRQKIHLRSTGDDFQIFYANHGQRRLLLQDSGNTEATIIIIPPHANSSCLYLKGHDCFSIQMGAQFLEQIEALCWEENNIRRLNIEKEILRLSLSGEHSSEVQALLSAIYAEYSNRRTGFRTVIKIKVAELLINLYRINRENSPFALHGMPPANIQEIIHYIETNYAESITLDGLSELSGLNPSYISRIFKESTGIPLFEYLNRIRIQKACHLLKRTELSILDIAYSVGYNNVSFFNRYFRRIMQMSPREYRSTIKT